MMLHRALIDTGFETFNPILNLGGLYILFMLTIVEFIVIGVIFVLLNIFRKAFKKINQRMVEEGGETQDSSDEGEKKALTKS